MINDKIMKNIGTGLLITGGLTLGMSLIPITIGFGTSGISAGSTAAGIQSSIGNVSAGSLFSILTSLGMTGTFTNTAGLGSILGFGGITLNKLSDKNKKKGEFIIKNNLIHKVKFSDIIDKDNYRNSIKLPFIECYSKIFPKTWKMNLNKI